MRMAVGFITYRVHQERLTYLRKAIERGRQFITASRDELVWFCTCESQQCPEALQQEAVRLCTKRHVTVCMNSRPPSMGANENNAMVYGFEHLRADFLMIHIDDCYAIEPVDLSDGIQFLQENPDVDILRYHWSSRKEAHPIVVPRRDGYMQVDPASKWFYDDSPHVRRANIIEKFGWHRNGLPRDSGDIEHETNVRLRRGKANIVATPFKSFEKDGPVSASR